jgi:hypothetical protein
MQSKDKKTLREQKLERKQRIDNVKGLSLRYTPPAPNRLRPQQAPDWELWAAMATAPVWQAVALSLDIDPGTPGALLSELIGDSEDVGAAFDAEFERRLVIAVNHLSVEGSLVPVKDSPGVLDEPSAVVKLRDFAAFAGALPKPWSLPEQFPRANGAPTGAIREHAPAAVAPNKHNKRWTPAALEELKSYREHHSAEKTAQKFSISTARVRQLLPSKDPSSPGYSVFTQRPKKA